MDVKRKFSLKSIIRQSTSNHGLSSHNTDRYHQNNGANDMRNDLVVNELKDEFINSYMKEKSSRESIADPLNVLNPDMESEVLNSIEKKYFQYITDPQIAEQFVFEGMPQKLDLNYLSEQKTRLKRQLVVVSKKVSDLILKNECKYKTELDRVTQLQTSLSDAIKVCTTGRKRLDCAKHDFTGVSLGIVASHRRREVLKSLLKSLQTIKTLQETDIRLRELLEEDEDYTRAIQLYLECHKVVSSLKHYNCISELNTKLQDTLEMTEEQIDVALSKMCLTFNGELYLKLMNAYNLLGKTQTAMDQLLMHFASAIHNKAFSIVLGYVELFANVDSSATSAQNYHKRPYNDLCKCLTTDSFLACLTDLCKALWDIMSNYYRILSFHRESDEFNEIQTQNTGANDSTFNKQFVIQKLEHGLGRIWQDVQQKVRTLVQNHDLSAHNFDDFIKILGIAEKMVEIGEEFCGNTSEELQNSLHSQTINYFKAYHKTCMSELKVFLDNEIWTLCPVHNFALIHLQEFQFLRTSLPSQRMPLSPNTSPNKSKKIYFSNHFLKQKDVLNSTTPFDTEDEDNDKEKLNANAIKDLETIGDNGNQRQANCRKISNGECSSDASNGSISEPIMTNTTLNILRLFGRYMQMMSILRPIAFDAMLCLFELFNYYLFTVYKFFAKDMVTLSETSLSNDMKVTLKRIADNLIVNEKDIDFSTESTNSSNKYFSPLLSNVVNMSSPQTLYGLAERVVAVESLVVLSNQFKYLRSYVEQLIPNDKISILQQYFNQAVSIASDLRKPTYMWVTVKCVQYEHIVSLMATTQWNIREILSMHNSYVDQLLRELQIFSMRLNEVFDQQLNAREIPAEVYSILWEHILRLANRTFVEGFSQSKKCSNEGRALMQLDFQQFLTKVESLTTIRPIPERELVEEYIKAYYLTEPALIEWIKTRREYNPKQIHGLVFCMTNDNKKMRTRILSALESNT